MAELTLETALESADAHIKRLNADPIGFDDPDEDEDDEDEEAEEDE